MNAFGVFFVFVMSVLFIPVQVYAKRVIYLPVVSSSLFAGTYDASSANPDDHKFCFYSNNIFERIWGTGIGLNKKTSGLYSELGISLRNTSALRQTVTIVYENLNFKTGFWKTQWIGIPDEEFLKTFNGISAKGYSLTVTIPPHQTQVIQFEFGCQGETSSNNCWLYQKPLLQGGVEKIAGQTFFGKRGSDNNVSSWNKYICYALQTVSQIRLEVNEDAGALIGSVYIYDGGSVTGVPALSILSQESFEINNGRSF